MDENPISSFTDDQVKPKLNTRASFNASINAWAQESLQLARNVYAELTPGQTLTQEWIENTRAILRRQLALGGYRLAHVLNHVNYEQFGSLPDRSPRENPDDIQPWKDGLYAILSLLLITLAIGAIAGLCWCRSEKRRKRNVDAVSLDNAKSDDTYQQDAPAYI